MSIPATFEEQKARIKTAAEILWETMDDNQRTAVRFGMFPANLMREAEEELKRIIPRKDVGRMLAIALMDCARTDGGMKA